MVFIFRSRRKKSPLIIQVSDEESPDHYRRVAQKKKFDDESVRIQSLIKRIQEIDEKIKIILEENVSDEAKKIIIHELGEEKRRLEEEVKRLRR
ncbi:MAG: hypothetical protein QXK24_01410 [Ignisphaera sp.]